MKAATRFLDAVAASGAITAEQQQSLATRFKNNDFAVFSHLLGEQAEVRVDRQSLAKLWADSLGVSCVDLNKTLFQAAALKQLSAAGARRTQAIPIYQFGDTLTVAMAEPTNASILQMLEQSVGGPVSPVFALPEDIDDAIEIQYEEASELQSLSGSIARVADGVEDDDVSEERLAELANSNDIVDLGRGILLLGAKFNASDIHIEPSEAWVRVRYRIDGVLQEKLRFSKGVHGALMGRLKVISGSNIVEKRRPQDGRFSLQLAHRTLDFRFSTIPTIYGEKVVLRLLAQFTDREFPPLEDLYFSTENVSAVRDLISTPNGVVFVTGPTGSGKTTTLYSMLAAINDEGTNIVTVEDPVEYRMPGITQVQVNPEIDLDFSTALRSILRQDPNVILIGEIRDLETARIASQAALTGHLVMATMHTNDSLQAVTRLVEIGVEPFLVAPSVIGVLAQRLVRRICENCKEPYAVDKAQLDRLFTWDGEREVVFYRGAGCDECGHSGYSGRIPIHEVFVLTDQIREMVANSASVLEVRQAAFDNGFKSLRYDGLKKVLQGLTTLEEVDRVA